jgi:hypothetical protein
LNSNGKNEWEFEPPIAVDKKVCVPKPECQSSALSILAHNNLEFVDAKRTSYPGSSQKISLKCKNGATKSTKLELHVTCNYDGSWKTEFKTSGAKACLEIKTCTKTALEAILADHNLIARAKFQLDAIPSEAKHATHLYTRCKSNNTPFDQSDASRFGFYIKCIDGSWIDGNGKRVKQSLAANAPKICSPKKNSCGSVEHGKPTPKQDCNSCTCDDGTITCTENICPKCTKASIKSAINHADAYAEDNSKPGETAKIACKSGYESSRVDSFSNSVILKCMADETWEPTDDKVKSFYKY